MIIYPLQNLDKVVWKVQIPQERDMRMEMPGVMWISQFFHVFFSFHFSTFEKNPNIFLDILLYLLCIFFFSRDLFVAKDVATWGDGELCTSTKPERPGANSRVCWCNGWKWQKSCFKLVHFSLARFICLSSFLGSYMVMITSLSSMSFSVIDSGVCFVLNYMPHEPNAFAFCLCRLCSYPPQPLDRPDGTTVTFQVFFLIQTLEFGSWKEKDLIFGNSRTAPTAQRLRFHFMENRLTRLHRLHLQCRNRCQMMGRWLRDWTWTKQQLKKRCRSLRT